MYRLRCGLTALGIAAIIFVGCNTTATKKFDLKVKHDEAWVKPPDAPQYNNAPEADYKKPAPKDTFRPGPGGMSQGMGGPMGPGQGMGR